MSSPRRDHSLRAPSPLSRSSRLPLVFLLVLLLFLPLLALSDVPADTLSPVPPPDGCTAIAVTLSASQTGPLTTHTNDCKDCDFRLSLVPRSSPPPHTPRAIPPSRFSYPRYVGPDRGNTLTEARLDRRVGRTWTETVAVGEVEEVGERWAYIDGSYGIQNEWGVGIGESTCAARLVAAPVYANGSALFDVSELTRIALERSRTAREAVMLIGRLAEEFGYYGAEWEGDYARGEAGEGLTIVDGREAWVFHITPDDSGASAVWAAQRVPDGHVAVISNAFIIQELNLTDSENFRASRNVLDVARRLGWWEEGTPLNFARVYGSRVSFEVYCSRRTWRVYTLVAPSLAARLSPDLTVLQLPFSVPVDRPLSVRDVFAIQRDHYENTTFDLTQGPAAGPYGNPNRYDRGEASGLPMAVLMQGTFERPISMFRTAYSFVTESGARRREHKVWFAPAAPHASVYSPLWPASEDVPVEYGAGAGSLYRWQEGSAWWAATSVGGWMERMYSYTSKVVRQHQHALEAAAVAGVRRLEHSLRGEKDEDAVRHALTLHQREAARNATAHWYALFHDLITTFHDGYHVDTDTDIIDPTALFYPYAWLRDVGFWGPRGTEPDWSHTTWSYTTDYTPGLSGAGGGEGAGVSWEYGGGKKVAGSVGWGGVGAGLLLLVVGLVGGWFIGRWQTMTSMRAEYRPIADH